MNFFAEITGLDRLENKFNKFQAQALKAQVSAVQDATLLVQETAIKLIQDNSSGTPTIRYKPKRVVNVSKPGDPPNSDTGRLVQSIKVDFKNQGLSGRVGTGLKYGAWLEFGTQKMDPRPWLSTALDLTKEAVADLFAKWVSGAIKDVEK